MLNPAQPKKWLCLVLTFVMLCGIINIAPNIRAEIPGPKSLNAPRTLTPPVIDGKPDETVWSVSELMPVRTGEGDFQDSKFGMLWDNQYLYIAVKTDDDKLVHNGTGHWFEQDHIGMFFDPNNHKSAPFVDNDMQIGLVYQPNTTTPAFYFGAAANHAAKDEKKILRAIGRTETGWTAEVAVPWDMLKFDPQMRKQLGFEIGVTDRDDPAVPGRTSMWSAYNSNSFWNDTSGYGNIILKEDKPVTGTIDDVLLEDNFDGLQTGETPFGWISDVNAGSAPMTVVKDTYGNGRMVFDGNAAGKQARISAPVQWDNYVIEADVKFEGVVNNARWAALMFRGAANGKQPYNQMAVRQNGTYEIAYRKPDNSWSVPVSGSWSKGPLALNSEYTWKVRVFDNNVKEYIKAKNDSDFSLLTDKSLTSDLLERGKIGFQADQSKVSFDNLKVTRIKAMQLGITVADTMEALTGPVSVTHNVYFSDGIASQVPSERVKLYSSDESVIKIIDNRIYPLKPGKASVKAVYFNAESVKEITVTPSGIGAQIVSLKHEEGYLLTDAGKETDLAAVTFQVERSDFTSGTVKGSELAWTSDSPQVVIANGKLTALKKGVYPVTAQAGSASLKMYVVAKSAADADYVLYEESFDTVPDGTLPQDWTRIEGSTASKAVVKSGALEIDASTAPDNPSRVLLPDYLGLFGNYTIEADVTHLAANDPARWNSIMYRVQNNNFPYYQMAVRQNATAVNGVEFAERTPANAWNVADKGSFSEAISADKMYHYTVKTHGVRVQEWIDDKLIIDNDLITAYAKGRIGLQANGSKMKVDNIRVKLQEKPLPPLPADRFVRVTEPETGISLAPTLVAEVGGSEDLVVLNGTKLPATAVLYLNKDLQVTDKTGSTIIGSLDSVLGMMESKVIPAFYVKDELTVDQLTDRLKQRQLEDAFVISDNGDLVKKARTAYPIIRGIVEFKVTGNLSEENLMEIRRKTNGSLAKIALLPQEAATLDNVSYLQERLVTVWAKEEVSRGQEAIPLHKLITSGVNGIVTDNTDSAWDALKVYDQEPTLIRKPLIIAHRGIPALAPENTLEGYQLAYEKGADVLETDIYLSKDGHLVIMHDPTLDRTTTGTGNVEDYTLEQLKTFKANKQFPAEYPDARIPTLAELFDMFKDKDVMHFVEIKSYKPETVEALIKLIQDKGVENQVVVISFNDSQLKLLGEKMPGMSLGFLTGDVANETNVNKSLRVALKAIQNINSTLNHSYPGLGKNFMEAAKHRGVTIWPWTYRDLNEMMKYYGLGTYGLTTDYTHWASDWASVLKPEQARYELKAGDSIELSAFIESYLGDIINVKPEVVLLDGQEFVEMNGNMINAKSNGTVHALLRYTASMNTGSTYDLYTQPILIEIGKGGQSSVVKGKVDVPWHHRLKDLSGFAVQLKADGRVVGETVTDKNGHYELKAMEPRTYTVEVSADGYLRAGQTLVIKKEVGTTAVKSITMYAGDFDGSGKIDDADAAMITNALNNKPVGDNARFDVDKDGGIDEADITVVTINLGITLRGND